MAEERNENFKLVTGERLNAWEGPYASVSAAIAAVPVAVRGNGLTVLIGSEASGYVEYWWQSGTADADLVVKASGEGGGTGVVDQEYDPASPNAVSSAAIAPVVTQLSSDISSVSEAQTVQAETIATVSTEVEATKTRLNDTETTLSQLVLAMDTTPLSLNVSNNTTTWSVSNGRNRSITLPNASVTVNLTNFIDGSEASLLVKQGTTGGMNVTLQMVGVSIAYLGDRNTPSALADSESLYILRRRGSIIYVEIKVLFSTVVVPPVDPPDEEEETAQNPLVGYATQGGGTTGGNSGSTVTVTTFAALKDELQNKGTGAKIVKISGTIEGDGAYIRVRANKTIIGLPGSVVNNTSFYINNQNGDAYNIIIQNVKINVIAGGDGVQCRQGAHHIWIDHCELNLEAAPDGGIDITDGCDYVTVSWCKLVGSDKGMLISSDAVDAVQKQRVTVHHCYFLNVFDREPACFYSIVHLYNNYHNRTNTAAQDYATGSREDALVRVERSYYRNLPGRPLDDLRTNGIFANTVSTNRFVNCGANRIGNALDSSYVPTYTYTMDPVDDVPDIVSAGAGQTLLNPTGSTTGTSSGGGSGGGSTDYGANPVVIGYGTQDAAGAPTGGTGGTTTTVTNYAELKAQCEDSTTRIIKVSGTISSGVNNAIIQVNSNKTIVGNTGSSLVGIALHVAGTDGTNTWKSNVIFQNLKITGVTAAGVDAMRLYMAQRVWIDHCEFSGNTGGDVPLEIIFRSSNITVSYCKFVDTNYALGIGSDEARTADRTYFNITVHHCHFLNCTQRAPRVYFGKVHLFNNFYQWNKAGSNNIYGIAVSFESTVKIEANYFEDLLNDPISTNTTATAWENLNNTFDNCGANSLAATPVSSSISVPYSYSTQLQNSAQARAEVIKSAGGAGATLVRS